MYNNNPTQIHEKIVQVQVNDFLFSVTKTEIENADIISLPGDEFHLLYNQKSVHAKILQSDLSGKNSIVEIEGYTFAIQIKDDLDQQLEKMGFGSAANKVVKEIKAPMPGLVLEIAVTNGQEVKAGDKIIILEAMKMENNIMINTQAKIKKIAVAAGQAVEKGQVLVELE